MLHRWMRFTRYIMAASIDSDRTDAADSNAALHVVIAALDRVLFAIYGQVIWRLYSSMMI